MLPGAKKPVNSHRNEPGKLWFGFREVLNTPQFITYAVGGNIALSGLFVYLSTSPSVFMEGYGLSVKTFGWIFAVITLGFIGLSQLNQLFSKHFKPQQIINSTLACMMITSITLLLGLIQNQFGLIETSILIFLVLGCIGIINPNAAALSVALFESRTGTASSLYGLLQWGFAGIASIIVGCFKTSSGIPLAAIMVATSSIAWLLITVRSRSKSKLASKLSVK